MRIALLLALACLSCCAALIPDVRALLNKKDFDAAEKLITAQKGSGAWTPELLEAKSWIGRGYLAAKEYDKALASAEETRKLCLALMKMQPLDSEKRLPIAFGATIEVTGQALAGKGQRSEGVSFLQKELKTYYATSIRTRVQKNINLLSLEGQPAPKLEMKEWVGNAAPQPLAKLQGKPTILFFWAHWCGDCKQQAPILEEIMAKYGPKGLQIVGPTQYYGYVAGGEDAKPAQEKAYIQSIYERFYKGIPGMTAPLSEENFKVYGSSTTPTLVLLDKKGLVRLYNPGKLTAAELSAKIEPLL